MKDYRRAIFIAILLISIGVIHNTILSETSGAAGTVLIAVGGLFFIIGSAKKKHDDGKKRPGEH